MLQRRMKLVGEFVSGPTHAAAVRASTLDHELWDHAMENQPIVKRPLLLLPGLLVGEFLRAFGQPHEIGYGLGRLLFEQPHNNVSLRSFKNSVRSCRSAHAFSLC